MDDKEDMDQATRQRSKRSTNFDRIEDVAICRCWKQMTNDAMPGTVQSSDDFWKSHFQKFSTFMIEKHGKTNAQMNDQRTWRAVRSRWRRCILKECMLFGSIYRDVREIEKKGWQENDYIKEALSRYKSMNSRNKDFLFLDCWRVLSDEPKFELMIDQQFNKTKSKDSTTGHVPNDIPETIQAESGAEAEGDGSAVSAVSGSNAGSGGKVRASRRAYNTILRPPTGAGHPTGVTRTKAEISNSNRKRKAKLDLKRNQNKEVCRLLSEIKEKMAHISKQMNLQSSFLGAFTLFSMGQTEAATLAAAQGNQILMEQAKNKELSSEGHESKKRSASESILDDDDDVENCENGENDSEHRSDNGCDNEDAVDDNEKSKKRKGNDHAAVSKFGV